MSSNKIQRYGAGTAFLAAGVVGGAVLAGSLVANAATPSPAPSQGGSSTAQTSPDTTVTGSEADKVKAAVKAKYSGTTITTVRKDPDGSYDALGTDSSGTSVFYDVSADLKTITANAGHGGPGSAQPPATSTSPTA